MRSSSNREPAELTVKAVGLGIFLAFVFGSANAYLGMKAGQTVTATIPAAVIAMALFRIPAFRGGVLEQNIARTAASVGEALVAGAIFTLPSFLLVEIQGQRLWTDLRSHYWEASFILLAGGLIGVFFIILLRRPLCVDAGLPWPESIASFEIVRAGQDSADAPRYIFGAMGFGGVIQFLKSDKGFQVFREYFEGTLTFPATALTKGGGIPWSTPALSPALMGIGYIIGPEYAAVNVSGGVMAWWLLIPLLLFFNPALDPQTAWREVVRPIAVGAMLVAAANTLLGMRGSITRSLQGAWKASLKGAHSTSERDRIERDLPAKWVVVAIFFLILPITGIYYHFTGSWAVAAVTAFVMAVTGFLLSAVGGYLVGLVGGSNQPLSGLTLSALVISALVMIAMGMKGSGGVAAVLGVAAVVACAASVSGSLIQDLKAGHLLGGTPWKMQVVEIAAVILLSFFLTWPILALHEANLATGGIGGRALPAPQAGLMAQLAKGIVGGEMAWGLLVAGAAFGLALILCGAKAPMLIAVGMYLPFDTSSAIFIGGVIKWIADRFTTRLPQEQRAKAEERGTLLASGLVAGEAILGIVLAVLFLAGISFGTWRLYPLLGGWLSLAAFLAVAWVLVRLPLKRLESGHAPRSDTL